ncbi:hypothetical protein [Flavobacteriaceae bacterium 14752]|uniref:hypothetical protein n=1 Tax=Mesohalobacter salilacus TaxID=2491711 RepID=UPI000F640E50|nr:hypothetical protein EIG84_02835 [Flavobacteriaceae bacterium 14752]
MKTNLLIKFSLCVCIAISSYAQTSKTYTESFNVNKDVQVSLKANNAEIIVETWNKNRVDVEATISVDVEDEKLANEILEHFKFEALGNSTKVEIRAGMKLREFIKGKHKFIADDGVVEILTEDIRGSGAPIPPVPPLPNMDFDIQFDMDRFNEDGKAYILKFQKEIRETMKDSNFKKRMRKWQNDFAEGFNNDSDSIKVFTYKFNKDIKPRIKFLRNHLDFDNNKIKKKIIIKMPKDAKLDLDVKRSELKITSLYQIDANLNYSGLKIDELTGENSTVSAIYSGVNITKANGLNLNLKYAKKVNIGEVNQLISTSKTSNLVIDLVNQKAIIEGSFGDLVINDISKDFTLIDINLKNSKAKLNLPNVAYNFYINSKSSDVSLDSKIDYQISEAFDSKIYQNKNSQKTSKVLNIKSDYSNFELY